MLVYASHLNWLANNVTAGETPFHWLGLGSAGVFLFFGLSGLLLTAKLDGGVSRFFLHRIRRIFPGFWLAVVLSALMLYWRGGPFRIEAGLLVLYPSDRLYETTVPYWTLVYEMAFYALVVVSMAALNQRAWPVILAGLVISFLLATKPTTWTEMMAAGWTDLAMSQVAIFFAVGVVVGRLPACRSKSLAAGGALIGTAIYFYVPIFDAFGLSRPLASNPLHPNQPSYFFQAIGVGIFLWSALGWPARGVVGRLLSFLGDASYGIYLMHISFMFVAAHFLRTIGATTWPFDVVWLAIGVIALPGTLLFGTLESRLQNLLKRSRWPAPRTIKSA